MIKRLVNKHDYTRANVYRAIDQTYSGYGSFYGEQISLTKTGNEVTFKATKFSAVIDGEVVSYEGSIEYTATVEEVNTDIWVSMVLDRIDNQQRNYPRFKIMTTGTTASFGVSIETDDGLDKPEFKISKQLRIVFLNETNPIEPWFSFIIPRIHNIPGTPGAPGHTTVTPVQFEWTSEFYAAMFQNNGIGLHGFGGKRLITKEYVCTDWLSIHIPYEDKINTIKTGTSISIVSSDIQGWVDD